MISSSSVPLPIPLPLPKPAASGAGPAVRSFALAFLFASLASIFTRPAIADEEETVAAAHLEHKLAYLSADYAMAAASTAPSDEGESDEHAKIADEIDATVKRLPLSPELASRVTVVGALVRRSAPASEIQGAVADAQRVLITTFHIPTAPNARLDAVHGQALFEQNCVPCHGSTGRADTERAAALHPHPANFLDPSVGEPLSPYRVSTTVRFGVDGTAMVPFGFLSSKDVWDLAFYVTGLRHVAPPDDEGPTLDISELAFLSDMDLRAKVRAAGVDEARVEPVLSDLRRRAPYREAASRGALAFVRRLVARARLAGMVRESFAPLELTGLVALVAIFLVFRLSRAKLEPTRRLSKASLAMGGALLVALALDMSSHRANATSLERKATARLDAVEGSGVGGGAEPALPAVVAERLAVRQGVGAPCSSPGYGPGPEPQIEKGPPFVVIFNCLWPSKQRMEISVALTRVAKRAEIESLLRGLWKNLGARMGKAFPETAKLCAYAPGATISDAPLGCVRKGYEPEGEPGEEEADVRIDMRPEPTEVAEALERTLRSAGARAPTVSFDATRSEVAVGVRYEDGEPSVPPSDADALLPLFIAAWDFYPSKSDATALSFGGVFHGRPIARVRIPNVGAFIAMDPWGVRRRLEEAGVPLALGRKRTAEQDSVLRDELRGAIAKLPRGSVALAPREKAR
jgi:mono/diheme cytochrome c family protein